MKKYISALAIAIIPSVSTVAQEVNYKATDVISEIIDYSDAFKHLDLSITAGSTGVGFDLAMPVTERVQVRAGATFMPHFEKTMHFGVQVGELTQEEYQKDYVNKFDTSSGETMLDYNSWVNYESDRRFNKLSGIMENMLGYKVDNQVDMIGEPCFNQFKMVVDVAPFKNKNWHISAGFFLGSSKIAKAYNTTYDMASLMCVATYNSMYYKALAEEPMISYGDINIYNVELSKKFKDYGKMSMHVGDFSHDIYANEDVYYDYDEVDPIFGEPVKDANGREIKKGSLRFAKGEKMYSKGDPYRMVPDEDYMVKANAFVKSFRPYLGFGYGGYLDRTKRTQLSFDCGLMFWGGVPEVLTHDGVDLIHDLENVKASVQKYLDIMQKFPVYPIIELRVSQRLF